jgi:hypothetical protein
MKETVGATELQVATTPPNAFRKPLRISSTILGCCSTFVKHVEGLKTFILNTYCRWCAIHGSAVGIATGCGLGDRGIGVQIPVESRVSISSRSALRHTQPPTQWVPGALSPEVKRQGRDADHSPPPSAEVKKMWIYISSSPFTFMTYCLIS